MGSCCGVVSNVVEEPQQDVPQRRRPTFPPGEVVMDQGEVIASKVSDRDKTKKKRASFMALGTVDPQVRRLPQPSRKNSDDTGSLTNGCTPTRTTTVDTGSAVPHVMSTTPSASPPNRHVNSRSVNNSNDNRGNTPHNHVGSRDGADALLSDVFHISASSSSLSIADCDALSASLVEVSQATQSFRCYDRTHSEIDVTSEWGEASLDRTARRRSQSRIVDRNRVPHLLSSEAEVRSSLTLMYLAQHCRLLLRCVKEQFIEQRVMMLRDHYTEHAAVCVSGLVGLENAAREAITQEWFAERAALAWRTSVSTTASTLPVTTSTSNTATTSTTHAVPAALAVFVDPLTELSDVAKRDDSLMHITSHTIREGEEEDASSSDGDSATRRSLSVRLCTGGTASSQNAFSAPCASRLMGDASSSTSTAPASPLGASSSLLPHSHGAVRKVSSAQQALHDRMVRGRKLSLQPSGSL